jgi:ATP-dependent Clp protease ATP-binding subunit ClpA
VVFEPLTKDEVKQIAVKYIDQVTTSLRRWGKTLVIEPEALDKLVSEGYSMAYGARFLKRVIDDRIKLPLSQRWKEANAFRVTVQDEHIVVESVGPRLLTSSSEDAIAV